MIHFTAFMDIEWQECDCLTLAWGVGLEVSATSGDDREPQKDMRPRKLGIHEENTSQLVYI